MAHVKLHIPGPVEVSAQTFAALCLQLIAAGLAAETPALLAEGVSTPDQRLTRATLGTLAATLDGASDSPAVILLGPLMEGA